LALPEPRLVVLAGAHEGEVFELGEEPFSIGRQSANRLKLAHASVSRRHCVIESEPDGFWLRDLQSLSGTFVNGAATGHRRLEHGDFVKVGECLLLYLSQPDDPRSPEETERRAEVESTLELSLADAHYLQGGRLRPALGREARHYAALLAASAEIQASRGVGELAQSLLERIFELTPARRAALYLDENDGLRPVRGLARGGREEKVEISHTLARRVLGERLAVVSNDVGQDPALAGIESLEGAASGALAAIPLVAFDRGLGIVWAEAPAPGPGFGRGELELLTALATIAAPALANARRAEWLEAENRRFRAAQLEHDLIGESPAIEKVLKLLARVAPTDLGVLVLGESGTGKELVAKALHRNSPRAEGPFVAVNCATLSETLLESELFGHEKGAFTGAVERKLGQFELAHGGTIFLDEVGEIPLVLQARLLRSLETREIQRVGGRGPIAVDVRVVAATHRDLETAARERTFREDLYHRLNVFALTLPPLRERGTDLALLANHFTARSARRLHRPVSGLCAEAHAAIAAHDWPGNVRELKNAIERAVVLAGEELLRPEDLPEAVLESASRRAPGAAGTYHEAVAEAKRQILLDAVRAAGGDYTEAARSLGLNRTYLHRLLTQLGLRSELES